MATQTAPTPALFERLGGEPAVHAAVDIFYQKIVSDPDLVRFFEGVDMVRLKGHQEKFLTMAFGGPKNYSGRSLEIAHGKLIKDKGLTATHFDMVAGHLVATLQQLGVGESMVDEVVAIAGPLRSIFPEAPQSAHWRAQ